jgi:Zn-dependent protease with chaperone function
MAITDGLLLIEAGLAQAQAHDEIFGTRAVDSYIQHIAAGLRPGQPVPTPPPGLFPGAADPRVVARQHQVLEEQIAFVMGHELGHHHLGHLPCTASADPIGAGEAARVLSSAVPLFNQPNEITADLAGMYNVLDAGRLRAARGAANWSEAGGLLTMRFFAGLSQLSPADLITAFERSHPPPTLRTPIIQQAAGHWRATGGNPLPVLSL